MPKIYLVGFMGAGKTTLGKQLARKMRWSFADTDNIAEQELGMSVKAVFDELGEEWFRKYEQKILVKTTYFQNTIISTGGGTPCFYNNMDIILGNGLCIYLHMTPKSIVTRLSQSKKPRPLLTGLSEIELEEYVKENLAKRETIYSRAHIIVDALSSNLIQTVELRIKEHFGTTR